MKEIHYKALSYFTMTTILILFRLAFFATVELTVWTADSRDSINYTRKQLLLPSYTSEFLLDMFFLTHLFYMGGMQEENLGV